MDIAEFLEARWAEREAAAKAATPGPWAWEATGEKDSSWAVGFVQDEDGNTLSGQIGPGEGIVIDGVCEGIDGNLGDAVHIALNDPAAVLADIEAKRKLLELAGEADEIDRALCDEVARRPVPGELLIGDEIRRALAAPFAAHPDCNPSWRPEA